MKKYIIKIISTVLIITFTWNQIAYATGGDFSALRPAASGISMPAESLIEALEQQVYYASRDYYPRILQRIDELLQQSLPDDVRERLEQLKSKIEQYTKEGKDEPVGMTPSERPTEEKSQTVTIAEAIEILQERETKRISEGRETEHLTYGKKEVSMQEAIKRLRGLQEFIAKGLPSGIQTNVVLFRRQDGSISKIIPPLATQTKPTLPAWYSPQEHGWEYTGISWKVREIGGRGRVWAWNPLTQKWEIESLGELTRDEEGEGAVLKSDTPQESQNAENQTGGVSQDGASPEERRVMLLTLPSGNKFYAFLQPDEITIEEGVATEIPEGVSFAVAYPSFEDLKNVFTHPENIRRNLAGIPEAEIDEFLKKLDFDFQTLKETLEQRISDLRRRFAEGNLILAGTNLAAFKRNMVSIIRNGIATRSIDEGLRTGGLFASCTEGHIYDYQLRGAPSLKELEALSERDFILYLLDDLLESIRDDENYRDFETFNRTIACKYLCILFIHHTATDIKFWGVAEEDYAGIDNYDVTDQPLGQTLKKMFLGMGIIGLIAGIAWGIKTTAIGLPGGEALFAIAALMISGSFINPFKGVLKALRKIKKESILLTTAIATSMAIISMFVVSFIFEEISFISFLVTPGPLLILMILTGALGYSVKEFIAYMKAREQRSSQLLAAIREINLATSIGLSRTIEITLNQVRDIADSPYAFVQILGESAKGRPLVSESFDSGPEDASRSSYAQYFSSRESLSPSIIYEGKPVMMNSKGEIRDRYEEGLIALGAERALCIPIFGRGEAMPGIKSQVVVALLWVLDKPNDYTDADTQAVAELSHFMSQAMETARTHESLALTVEYLEGGLSRISHELRNALSSLGWLPTMRQAFELADTIDAVIRGEKTIEDLQAAYTTHWPSIVEGIGEIEREVPAVLRYLEEFLRLNRVREGREPLYPKKINVGSYIERAIRSAFRRAQEKGLKISSKIPEELPMAAADIAALEIVLNNLISNAIKYTEKGSIKVTAHYDEEEEMLAVSVSDTGIGIAEDQLPKLFERFERAREVEEGVEAGFGIGLHTVRAYVERMGGTISVTSKLGEGSTFTFTLPLARNIYKRLNGRERVILYTFPVTGNNLYLYISPDEQKTPPRNALSALTGLNMATMRAIFTDSETRRSEIESLNPEEQNRYWEEMKQREETLMRDLAEGFEIGTLIVPGLDYDRFKEVMLRFVTEGIDREELDEILSIQALSPSIGEKRMPQVSIRLFTQTAREIGQIKGQEPVARYIYRLMPEDRKRLQTLEGQEVFQFFLQDLLSSTSNPAWYSPQTQAAGERRVSIPRNLVYNELIALKHMAVLYAYLKSTDPHYLIIESGQLATDEPLDITDTEMGRLLESDFRKAYQQTTEEKEDGELSTGAGMIPFISWVLNKLGISLKWQALVEQVLFWAVNFGFLAIPGLGSILAAAITWSIFTLLHFFKVKGIHAPPFYSILAIAAMNALALAFLPAPYLAPAFIATTAIHHIANVKVKIPTPVVFAAALGAAIVGLILFAPTLPLTKLLYLLPLLGIAATGREGGRLGFLLNQLRTAGSQLKRETTIEELGVMAEKGDLRAIDALLKLSRKRDPLIRAAAIRILARARTKEGAVVESIRACVIRALDYRDPVVRCEAVDAMRSINMDDSMKGKLLMRALRKDSDPVVRQRAAHALVNVENPDVYKILIEALRDDDPDVAKTAADTLGERRDPGAIIPLIEILESKVEKGTVRVLAVYILGRIDGKAAFKALIKALKDKDKDVRDMVVCALGERGDRRAIRHIVDTVLNDKSEHSDIRWRAAQALGMLGGIEAVKPLRELLHDRRADVRAAAAESLGRIGYSGTIDDLKRVSEDEKESAIVREAAKEAVDKSKKKIREFEELSKEALSVKKTSDDEGDDTEWRNRQSAVRSLSTSVEEGTVNVLTEVLIDDDSKYVRWAAADALGYIGDESAVPALVRTFKKEKDKDVCRAAIDALRKIGSPKATNDLIRLLDDCDQDIFFLAYRALANIDDPRAQSAMKKMGLRPRRVTPIRRLKYIREIIDTENREKFDEAGIRQVMAAIIELQRDPEKKVTIGITESSTIIGLLGAVERADIGEIDWKRVHVFQLDERKGLSPKHRRSVARLLRDGLDSCFKAGLPPGNVHYIDGMKDEKWLKDRYVADLNKHNGLDILVIGIGRQGQLISNAPDAPVNSRAREVELDPDSIETDKRDYPGIVKNRYVYTLGVKELLDARRIFLLACGNEKANIVRQTLMGSVTEKLAASKLQQHGNLTVILDSAAASHLKTAFNCELGGRRVDDPHKISSEKLILEDLVSGNGLEKTYYRLKGIPEGDRKREKEELIRLRQTYRRLKNIREGEGKEKISDMIVDLAADAHRKKEDGEEVEEEEELCLTIVLKGIEVLAEKLVELVDGTKAICETVDEIPGDPVRIALVGGVAEGGGDFYLNELQRRVDEAASEGTKIEIIPTKMGDEREVIGAVVYPRLVSGYELPDERYAIGIDIGGTYIRANVVDLKTMRVVSQARERLVMSEKDREKMMEIRAKLEGIPIDELPAYLAEYLSPEDLKAHAKLTARFLNDLKEIIKEVMADFKLGKIGYVGIALPGIHEEEGPVQLAYNVPITGVDVKKELRESIHLPIYAGNDVACGAVGELVAENGAGRDLMSLYALNVGTGLTVCLAHKLTNYEIDQTYREESDVLLADLEATIASKKAELEEMSDLEKAEWLFREMRKRQNCMDKPFRANMATHMESMPKIIRDLVKDPSEALLIAGLLHDAHRFFEGYYAYVKDEPPADTPEFHCYKKGQYSENAMEFVKEWLRKVGVNEKVLRDVGILVRYHQGGIKRGLLEVVRKKLDDDEKGHEKELAAETEILRRANDISQFIPELLIGSYINREEAREGEGASIIEYKYLQLTDEDKKRVDSDMESNESLFLQTEEGRRTLGAFLDIKMYEIDQTYREESDRILADLEATIVSKKAELDEMSDFEKAEWLFEWMNENQTCQDRHFRANMAPHMASMPKIIKDLMEEPSEALLIAGLFHDAHRFFEGYFVHVKDEPPSGSLAFPHYKGGYHSKNAVRFTEEWLRKVGISEETLWKVKILIHHHETGISKKVADKKGYDDELVFDAEILQSADAISQFIPELLIDSYATHGASIIENKYRRLNDENKGRVDRIIESGKKVFLETAEGRETLEAFQRIKREASAKEESRDKRASPSGAKVGNYILIENGNVVTPSGVIEGGSVLIKDGVIQQVRRPQEIEVPAGRKIKTIDARGKTVGPGIIDIHVHGVRHNASATDVTELENNASIDNIRKMAEALHQYGITSFLAAACTAPMSNLLRFIDISGEALKLGIPGFLGIHIEGPHVNKDPNAKGGQPTDYMREPTPDDVRKFIEAATKANLTTIGASKHLGRFIWTMAPELYLRKGLERLIMKIAEAGIFPSMGHFKPTEEELGKILKLAERLHKKFGIRMMITHAWNGTARKIDEFLVRMLLALDGKVFPKVLPTIILDLLHLPRHEYEKPYGLGALFEWFRRGNPLAIISDGLSLGGETARVGVTEYTRMLARDADPSRSYGNEAAFFGPLVEGKRQLCGSATPLNVCLRNALELGFRLEDAFRMTSTIPAQAIGDNSRGSIEPEKRGDLVILDEDKEVTHTIIGGKVVYTKEETHTSPPRGEADTSLSGEADTPPRGEADTSAATGHLSEGVADILHRTIARMAGSTVSPLDRINTVLSEVKEIQPQAVRIIEALEALKAVAEETPAVKLIDALAAKLDELVRDERLGLDDEEQRILARAIQLGQGRGVSEEGKLAKLIKELAKDPEGAWDSKLQAIYEICDRLAERSLPILTVALRELGKEVGAEMHEKIIRRLNKETAPVEAEPVSYLQRAAYDALMQDVLRRGKENPYDDAQEQLGAAIEIMEEIGEPLEPEIIEILSKPEMEVEFDIPVNMDSGAKEIFKAFRVIWSTLLGPAAGGERYHEDAKLEMDYALSWWMAWKCALCLQSPAAKRHREEFVQRASSNTEYSEELRELIVSILKQGLGGSKGVVVVPDVKGLSDRERAQIGKGKGYELARRGILHISKDKPAGDVGTGNFDCDYITEGGLWEHYERGEITNDDLTQPFESVEELRRLENEDPLSTPMLDRYFGPHRGLVTGKSIEKGGTPGRTGATGRGLFYNVERHLELMGKEIVGLNKIKGMSVVVQGAGKVGSSYSSMLYRAGAKVVAQTDIYGGTFNPDGLNIPELLEHLEKTGCVVNFPGGTNITNEEALELDCDRIAPCATEDVIHIGNADKIKAAFEDDGANGAATPEADAELARAFGERKSSGYPEPHKPEWLHCSRKTKPDGLTHRLTGIWANSGGVTASYFEKVQNLLGESWGFKEEDRLLKELMESMTDDVVAEYRRLRRMKPDITYAQTCRILAIRRLAEAASERLARERGGSPSLAAQEFSVDKIKAKILDIIRSEPERVFSFEDIKEAISSGIPDDELREILDGLCKQRVIIRVEARLLALINYYKKLSRAEPQGPEQQTLIQRYEDSIIAVFGISPPIPEIDQALKDMRKNYVRMRQSYIANTKITRNTITNQQLNLLERLAGKRLSKHKIDAHFAHKLLEYITSDEVERRSLGGLAKSMGMELGELPKTGTKSQPTRELMYDIEFAQAA